MVQTTPATLTYIPTGIHTISLILDGYNELSCEVTVIGEGTAQRQISFTPLAALTAQNLLNVRIYPNPFKPYDGRDEIGKPYDGSNNSGIIFDHMTENATIKIFNLAGEPICELRGTGRIPWDARNEKGKEVASGVYIYLITDKAGNKPATGKLVIIK